MVVSFGLLFLALGVHSHPSSLTCQSGKQLLLPGSQMMGMTLRTNDFTGIGVHVRDESGATVNQYTPGAKYKVSVSNFGVKQTIPCGGSTCNVPEEWYTDSTGTEVNYATPYIALRASAKDTWDGAGSFSELSTSSMTFTNKTGCPWQIFQTNGTIGSFNASWTAPSDSVGDVALSIVTSRGPPNYGSNILSGPHSKLFTFQTELTGPAVNRTCFCCTKTCNSVISSSLTLTWQLHPSQSTAMFRLDYTKQGWLGLGLGSAMLNSFAVVGKLGDSSVKGYQLAGYDPSSIDVEPAFYLWNTALTSTTSSTSMTFYRNYTSSNDTFNPESGSVSFLVAAGEGTGFQKHTESHVKAIDLLGLTPPTPTPSPTPSNHSSGCGCCTTFCTVQVGTKQSNNAALLSWRMDLKLQTITLSLTVDQESWIGIGVGDTMLGSRVVIARPDTMTVQPYQLDAFSLSGVKPEETGYVMTNPQWAQSNDPETNAKTTTVTFTRPFSCACDTIDPSSTKFIYAMGPVGNGWAVHSGKNVVAVSLLTGTAEEVANGNLKESYVKAHGALMTVAWGFLIPLGVIMSVFKNQMSNDGLWFKLHRAIQTTAVGLTVIAFSLIYIAHKKAGLTHFDDDHGKIGLAVMALACFMPVFAVIRPKADPKTLWRAVWEFVHKKLGYVLLITGFVNVVLGIKESYMSDYLSDYNDNLKKTLFSMVVIVGTFFMILQGRHFVAVSKRDIVHEGFVQLPAGDGNDGSPGIPRGGNNIVV